MEYLEDNLEVWYRQVVAHSRQYCVVNLMDCPGQMELYTHLWIFREIIYYCKDAINLYVLVLFVLDSLYLGEICRYVSGSLQSTYTNVHLDTYLVNVLSKVDIFSDRKYVCVSIDKGFCGIF